MNRRKYIAVLGGVICIMGAILLVWWNSRPNDPMYDMLYDNCLMVSGNTSTCDAKAKATLRSLARERVAAKAMKKEAARMLAAGVSKREVVKWAIDKGFVGSDLSDAVGITLEDLRAGKY